ncbi:MAG: serine hydrolase [Polaribacter sp.]
MKINNYPIIKNLIVFFILLLMISCQKEKVEIEDTSHQEIRTYINHIIKRHQIPGVSLAIIKNDSLLMKEHFGKANLEHNVPLSDSSIFRVYSLTKPIVSVAIFQLIEKGKLSLEDEISKYLKELPQTWNTIKIKHLLTHSSGLPDMVPFSKIEKLTEKQAQVLIFSEDLLSEKGEKYQYNQTNSWLLQKIIKKVSGEKMKDFIIDNQFKGERKNVFFSSDSKQIVSNRVTPYFYFETGKIQIDHPSLVGDYMFASNGLNITLNEFIKWHKRLKNNELLKLSTKENMWKTFDYTKSDKIFAFSWNKINVNKHPSCGFSGSYVTAYRIFPDDDLSIVFFANGLGNYFDIDNIINHIASLVDDDIVDINNLVYEKLSQAIIDEDLDEFKKVYSSIEKDTKFKDINLENMLNDVGYQLINQKRMDKAIDVFRFNTIQNPTSANTFDSLGEAYFIIKDNSLAIENYKKAIDLGGTNGNAKRMLNRISKNKID